MNKVTHSAEVRKELMIQNAMKAHGDLYDYSKVVYTTAREKIEIVCKKHGSFWQVSDSHIKGRGCPVCGHEKSLGNNNKLRTTEAFIKECNEKHNSAYTYEKTKYIGKAKKLIITCPEHGDFEQKAESHRIGAGCPKCGIKKAHTHFLQTTEYFIEKSREVHGDTYDYSISNYKGKDKPIDILCKSHGKFTINKANEHYVGHCVGCPKCSMSGTSKQEQELQEYIISLLSEDEVKLNVRSFISPLELDILIPSKKLAIEYNGAYWHSEEGGKDRNYHLNKTERVEARGYQLVHVMEYEWKSNQEVVKSRLRHLLGMTTNRYYARKLEVGVVSRYEADEFFTKTHIQGPCGFSLAYGLYDDGLLVACMSFGRNRFTKEEEIELIRYSTLGTVIGGFSKLLKVFQRNNPTVPELFSYSDRRWSVGKVYQTNGFEKVGTSAPGYSYVDKAGNKFNRVRFQKHKLGKLFGKGFNPLLSEAENMANNGYLKVFDSGMDKWRIKFG